MNLADYIKNYEDSASKFAKRAKVPQSVISRVINGVNEPSIRNAVRIVLATGGLVSIEDLSPKLFYDGGKKNSVRHRNHP